MYILWDRYCDIYHHIRYCEKASCIFCEIVIVIYNTIGCIKKILLFRPAPRSAVPKITPAYIMHYILYILYFIFHILYIYVYYDRYHLHSAGLVILYEPKTHQNSKVIRDTFTIFGVTPIDNALPLFSRLGGQ